MAYEVTIGIPVYNVEKYIRTSLESALAQTFQSIEFLICDDCGTDASIDIVREYQQTHPRGKDIHIVHQPHNKGVGEARNLIVDSAKGKFLYFMDADDAITEDAISILYENLVKYKAEIVYGSYNRIKEFGDHTDEIPFIYPSVQFLEEDAFANYAYGKYGRLEATTWNILIDIDVFRRNGIRYKPINFWEDMTTTMDLPTYVSRAVLLPQITYKYYCRYGSLSNYQKRDYIEKDEILHTIWAIEQVKANGIRIKDRPYYPEHCYIVQMTCFYMACAILRNEKVTNPRFTNQEIRSLVSSPLRFSEICRFKTTLVKNLALYVLGILPAWLCVFAIRMVGKKKGLV